MSQFEIIVQGTGIDPTGQTPSDSAIQTPENNAPNGSVLVFPAGTYLLANYINKKSGVSWRGSGKFASVLRAASATFPTSMIVGNQISHLEFRDLGFDTSALVPSGLPATISISNALFVDFISLHLTGIQVLGILLDVAVYCRIESSNFIKQIPSSQLNEGIWIRATTPGSSCGGIRISGNNLQNTGIDLRANPAQIIGNFISGQGYGAGITVDYTPDSANMLIVGNICNGGTGIDQNGVRPLGIENWAPHTSITANQCAYNSGDGIDCLDNVGCVVDGSNTIFGNNLSNTVVWRSPPT